MRTTVEKVTRRIIERSSKNREAYLQRLEEARGDGVFRKRLPSSNFAHDLAGCAAGCRTALLKGNGPNIAIISSYNDIVSAHQPYQAYPEIIKKAVSEAGGTAQFAGGVPAMCDGVTQGQPGMDLSLISRDVIAMSTVIGLSHNVFDGALLLGVCDKIMPGLLMGGLQFGHLPMILVPAGPMTSGLPNREKTHVRELFAEGKIDREEMLISEVKTYHSPGTCTFYGTANSNQLMAEMLGMHLPGSSFVNAGTTLRDALTRAASARVTAMTHLGDDYTPVGHVISPCLSVSIPTDQVTSTLFSRQAAWPCSSESCSKAVWSMKRCRPLPDSASAGILKNLFLTTAGRYGRTEQNRPWILKSLHRSANPLSSWAASRSCPATWAGRS
jgi:phosphogluconate dehydratase